MIYFDINMKVHKYIVSIILLSFVIIPLFVLARYTDCLRIDAFGVMGNWIHHDNIESVNVWHPGFCSSEITNRGVRVNDFYEVWDKDSDIAKEMLDYYHTVGNRLSVQTILAFFIALFFCMTMLNKYIFKDKFSNAFILFAFISYIFVNCMTSTQQFFYCMVDSFYVFGFIFTIITLSLYIGAYYAEPLTLKVIFIILMFMSAFWTCGYKEFHSIIIGFIFFYIFVFRFLVTSKKDYLAVFLFILGLCYFCFSLFSPDSQFINQTGGISGGRYLNGAGLKEHISIGLYDFYSAIKNNTRKILSVEILPFSLPIAVYIHYIFKKQNMDIHFCYVLPFYILIFLMALSVWYVGDSTPFYHGGLTENIEMIFAIVHILLISCFINFFCKNLFCRDIYMHVLKPLRENIQSVFSMYSLKTRMVLYIIHCHKFSICCFLYVAFIFYIIIHGKDLPSRIALRDVIKGYGKTFYEKILDDYDTLLASPDDVVILDFYKGKIPTSICINDSLVINLNEPVRSGDTVYYSAHRVFLEFFDKRLILWKML